MHLALEVAFEIVFPNKSVAAIFKGAGVHAAWVVGVAEDHVDERALGAGRGRLSRTGGGAARGAGVGLEVFVADGRVGEALVAERALVAGVSLMDQQNVRAQAACRGELGPTPVARHFGLLEVALAHVQRQMTALAKRLLTDAALDRVRLGHVGKQQSVRAEAGVAVATQVVSVRVMRLLVHGQLLPGLEAALALRARIRLLAGMPAHVCP